MLAKTDPLAARLEHLIKESARRDMSAGRSNVQCRAAVLVLGVDVKVPILENAGKLLKVITGCRQVQALNFF